MSFAINRLGKQLSAGTQHFAQQAAAAAQAAGASIVAGLRTCDERSAALKDQFEIRIENASINQREARKSTKSFPPDQSPSTSVYNVKYEPCKRWR